jgi:hypothetical protein
MPQIQDKIDVKFLIEKEEDGSANCFAYFPKMFYNKELYKTTFTSYAHIGQHSACHEDYAKECTLATKDQYKDLEMELVSIGYELNILN